jgi:U3 small nucleolar RNA-associated protein 25
MTVQYFPSPINTTYHLQWKTELIHLREDDSDSVEELDPEDQSIDGDSAEEDDENDAPQTVRPYVALLQAFNDTSAPKAKRRKLEHQESPSPDHASAKPMNETELEDLDHVDDDEEDAPAETDERSEDDSEDESDLTDPFDVHFAHPDEALSARRVQAAKKGEWTTERALMQPWRATLITPGVEEKSVAVQSVSNIDSLKLKQKLKETAQKKMRNLNDAEKKFGSLLFEYRDLLHCERTVQNSHTLRQLVCLHALNHVFK